MRVRRRLRNFGLLDIYSGDTEEVYLGDEKEPMIGQGVTSCHTLALLYIADT
jgi:hypothetical protein